MTANTFGNLLKLHSFGESHGMALGAVIEGCPAGLPFDEDLLKANLQRRRPGQSSVTSSRPEKDEYEILSGVYNGLTLGTPMAIVVKNKQTKSEDYKEIDQALNRGEVRRPGHADDLWRKKFGHSDVRGGGRASGRETLARVIGGSLAEMINRHLVPDLKIKAFTEAIHEIRLNEEELSGLVDEGLEKLNVEASQLRMPQAHKSQQAVSLLEAAKAEGKSYGGRIKIWIQNAPVGLGQPVFKKLKSDLAAALMGIGATSAIEFGDGFQAALSEGSKFHGGDSTVYGGIRGGLSTGELIDVSLTFKPTSSVLDVAKKGRHDPCIVPRAVPVAEAMAHLVIADHLLLQRLDQI